MTWTPWPELTGLTYTDLSAMIYVVPLLFVAIAIIMAAVSLTLASQARFSCPRCDADFSDRDSLYRHMSYKHGPVGKTAGKDAEREPEDYRRAA